MILIATIIIGALFIIIFIILIALGGKKTRAAAKKIDNYKINTNSENICPNCEQPLPAFRKPQGMREILFGGWTCANCKTKLDKFGRVIE